MPRSRRVRYRDVVGYRWETVSRFYWRLVTKQEMRVCSECEKARDNDPARAATFSVVRDGRSVWLLCTGCGRKERLKL